MPLWSAKWLGLSEGEEDTDGFNEAEGSEEGTADTDGLDEIEGLPEGKREGATEGTLETEGTPVLGSIEGTLESVGSPLGAADREGGDETDGETLGPLETVGA